MLTRKKNLIIIKNEVTNSESLTSEIFFSQAFYKVASFTLVLDLMHECYIILFPDIFHFLICRSTYFVYYFHLSTSKKLNGNEIGIPSLTLRTREKKNEKVKRSPTNKTHLHFLLVIFDVLRLYVVTKKS